MDSGGVIRSELGINAVPTRLYFKNGKLIKTVVGAVDKEGLEEEIEKAFKMIREFMTDKGEIRFTEGLNVVCGPNRSGKSGLLRSIAEAPDSKCVTCFAGDPMDEEERELSELLNGLSLRDVHLVRRAMQARNEGATLLVDTGLSEEGMRYLASFSRRNGTQIIATALERGSLQEVNWIEL